MKHKISFVLVLAIACAICSVATHFISYHRGFEKGYSSGLDCGIGQGCFHRSVAFLTTLQKLRAGNVPSAVHVMEKVCFDSAHIFYQRPTPGYPDAATTRQIAKVLSNYRATYRTNAADWDDMERKLAVELARIH
ncbi:MAG TPA: hypothetical protein VHH88_03380 [Verrucomicrobiae bacterium]|nr:hypothetical protein [Verrucomicrobiae bacterium]